MSTLIFYATRHGCTEKAAEILKSKLDDDVTIINFKDNKKPDLSAFDTIIIGSPNHMGNATRGIRKFIDGLGKINLEGKLVAVFDTYMAKDFEKAVQKMEKQIGEKAPSLVLAAPGLSVRVDGMKGPVTEGELPKCQEFGVRIGNRLKA